MVGEPVPSSLMNVRACALPESNMVLWLGWAMALNLQLALWLVVVRGPELASGAAEAFLERLSQSYLAELMQCCCCTKSDDMQQVLSDFSFGKASIMSYLTQKLQCWRILPWRLAALALTDTSEARRHAQAALDEFRQHLAVTCTVSKSLLLILGVCIFSLCLSPTTFLRAVDVPLSGQKPILICVTESFGAIYRQELSPDCRLKGSLTERTSNVCPNYSNWSLNASS